MGREEDVAELKLKYVDDYGQIVQKDRDGGDSLNRIGTYGALTGDSEFVTDVLKQNSAHLPEGRYCRNPTPTHWYNNMDNVTRDQMIMVESAWAVCESEELVKMARTHMKLRLKRFLFHFSSKDGGGPDGGPLVKKFPDAPAPEEFGIIIRACRLPLLYPLLLVFDLFFLGAVLLRNANRQNRWDADTKIVPMIRAANARYPTPIARLARWLYGATDAPAHIEAYYGETNGNNGIAPLGRIMIDCFNKEFK